MSNFLLTRYDAAYNDFSSALLSLRGNQFINYESLGLKFKLFFAEVLFNRGLTQIHMDHVQEGLADMQDAQGEKATEEHGVIDHAIQDRGEGCTVFSIVSRARACPLLTHSLAARRRALPPHTEEG